MYNSPIEMLITDIQHQIVEQQDEQIYQAVLTCITNVDKQELIRALQYDREQYDRGFADGYMAAKGELVLCRDCKHYDNSEGICWCKINSKFFPGGVDWHGFPEDGFCSYGERKEN